MNFLEYALRISSFVPTRQDEVDYSVVLPATIAFAENYLYRELDLLTTVTRDSSLTMTAGSRDFTLPQSIGRFITVQGINAITPSATSSAEAGTRNQLQCVSRDFLDAVWNSASNNGVPSYFAFIDDQNIVFGPWPDSPYLVEVIGTIRPAPLSLSRPNTYLTLYFPDLFFAASMIFFSRNLIDYGIPPTQGPEYWTAQTQVLLGGAKSEEARRKWAAGNWTSYSTPIGKPL